jgi:hypothetical protein
MIGAVNYIRGRPAASGGALTIPLLVAVSRDETITSAAAQGGAQRCSASPEATREGLRLRLTVLSRDRTVLIRFRVPQWFVSLGISGCISPTRVDPLEAVARVPVERFSERSFGLVITNRVVTPITNAADPRRRLRSTLSWSIRVNLARLSGYPVRSFS